MPMADADCQAVKVKLQQELKEANTRKLKLEESIRTLDAASTILIEKGALEEIEAYRKRSRPA
jgi:hypothetical protein